MSNTMADNMTTTMICCIVYDGCWCVVLNGGAVELPGIGALGRWRRQVSRAAPTAESALRHLLLTVDVDRLYR